MTILELNVYNTLQAMEAEKAEHNIEPTHTLLVRDHLRERVEMAISMPVSELELRNALHNLTQEGCVNIGQVMNDIYIAINYFHFFQ